MTSGQRSLLAPLSARQLSVKDESVIVPSFAAGLEANWSGARFEESVQRTLLFRPTAAPRKAH